jgi:hypothetical protein
MPKVKKVWVCQTWKKNPQLFSEKHVFDEETDDGWCPVKGSNGKPDYHGILKEEIPSTPSEVVISFPHNNQQFKEGDNITITAEVNPPESDVSKVEFFVDDKNVGEDILTPYTFTYHATKGPHLIYAKAYKTQGDIVVSALVSIAVAPVTLREVGLSVILMDASESMEEVVYEGSKVTKLRLVANTAASGIFDLERLLNNPNALVAAFKFDDRLEPLFLDTIANLISKFDKDVTRFANYIHDELKKMLHGTDINQALTHAHTFVDKFLKKQVADIPMDPNYRVMMQRILKYGSSDAISIPNVRVLLYTDGKQFDKMGGRILRPNPFIQYPLEGLNHDIVIGAFFGKGTDDGCTELQSLLSKCPIHDELQFFLFDDPSKINNLRYLFRMASGASGFCPKCLEKEMFN